MKSSRRSRRHRNPKNEEQKQPFFSQGKAEKQPFFQTNNNSAVQKKGLTVGAPDSKEEKEADTVAKQAINRQEEGGEEKLEKKSEVNRTKLATPKEYEKFGTKDEAMKHDRDIQEKPIQKQDDKEEPVQKMGDKEEAVQKQEEDDAVSTKLQRAGEDKKAPPSFEEL
ncbi:MAG: hypothetical protein KDD15_33500, partial [Lewinella sp.]|nr:hypothetical protein [Lewinella sp.]